MGKFSKIKKYNLDSLSIDEKIKFLDKEMEKTGLCEIANSTSGMYSVQGSEPNPSHNAFKSLSHDGQPLGFSGADFHIFTEPIGGFQYSPPHPVTGERRKAFSWFGIASGFQPLSANSDRQILWIFDQSLSGGFGRYFSLELTRGSNPFWGTWISTAFGTEMLVPYNSSNSPLSDNIKNNLNNLNINNFLNPDDFGSPTNPVLFQNDLGDPNFLPIDVAKRFIAELLGLAGEGLEYLGTAAADPIGSLTRMGTLGLLQLGSFIQSVVGVEEVNRGMVNAMQQLLGHHNNNNPLHPDFRKHDPTSPNYEGPKPLDLDKKTAEEITKRLDTAISNLNRGNGPTNPNGNLTPDEITQVSDEMNRPYQNGSRDPASVTFYNSLHSLPPNATTFTVKDGKFDYFDTNYVFTDPRDANPLGGKLPDKLGNFVSNVVHGVTTQAVGNYGAGGGEPFYQYSVDDPKYGRGPNNKVIGTQYNTQTSFKRSTIYESYITEGVKLGHFNPEALTVDIEDIRKGIMPEFPEKPPAEMIDGYSAKSKLAPKVIKGEPTIKVTKKDLEALHILKDSEIKELLQQIDLINAHLQNNPADLIYAQQRYPKTDIRLAKLNWKMDQMMNASKEYLDTQFPENQRLVDRIKKATKKTMELTNPEAYKNLNKPDMELMSLDDHMRQKRIVSRHFKKKRQSKSMFRVDMNKVKEKNRKVAEQKVAEWQEKRRIELLNSNEFEDQKYDWRKEIGEDFVNTTQGMKVGQTFTHAPSGQTVTTGGVLGGIETIQTSVELFGDAIPGPDAKQYGLQGFAKPIDIMRRGKKKTEELNKELDSSEDYTKEIKADEFMKGRVEDSVDSALLSDLGYKSPEDILGEVGDQWTYIEYMEMRNAIGDRAAAKSLPITMKILEYRPPQQVPISLIDAQEAITIARQKAEEALDRAWELYNKIPEPQGGFGGGQGNPTNRRGSAFNKDGSLNLGSKADMTYKDVTDALNAIADKYNKKRDPLYAAIRDRRAGAEAADKIDAYNRAHDKEDKAVLDAWDEYNKQKISSSKNRRSNYTPQEIAQNRENLKNSIITTLTGVIDGARNLNRVNYALNLAKRQSAKSGGSTRINTIPANSLGGRNNPVETKMHFQSKKAFIKSVDLNNTDYDIASQIVNNSADATQYALGFKAVHSQIPTEGGSQENNVKLNSKGDLEMFDNYAFRPDGYENFEAPVPIVGLIPGVPKIPVGKIAGKVDNKLGTEFQKDLATQIDKAGPVGWLSHALLGDIPDRQDPAVRIKTTITKKELIKILGAADYKIFVNRMNKERKKRKVNESNTFSKIKKFKNKY